MIKFIEHLVNKRPGGMMIEESHDHGTSYDKMCLMIPIDGNVGEQMLKFGLAIAENDLSGSGLERFPHITVKYGFTKEETSKVIDLLRNTDPFTITLGRTSLFSNNEDVVKLDIMSEGLIALNLAICNELDWAADTRLEYVPHATIAYVKKGTGWRYADANLFKDIEITANSCVLADANNAMQEIHLRGVEG